VRPGVVRIIGGYTITGGMIYLGNSLVAPQTGGTDPALIDPALDVGGMPNRTGEGLTYWPGYGTISPDSRAAYLGWLAGGRNDPHTPIGYVFLYFYGLERRILHDCMSSQELRAELPALRLEVARLLEVYGANRSFRRYSAALLSVVDLLLGRHFTRPPIFDGEKWPVPLELRIGLGAICRGRAPIPAHWALAWALFHPQIYPRTAASRCPEEFTRLFSARYAYRFGPGMVVKPPSATIAIEYQPASAGLPKVSGNTAIPEIFNLVEPAEQLKAIVEQATEELEAYSRWLGRYPDSRGSLDAVALLPSIMIDPRQEPVRSFLGSVGQAMASDEYKLIEGSALVRAWSGDDRAKLTKQQSTALARLLGDQGIGVEPDPRFAGGALGPGPTVLFRLAAEDTVNVASTDYLAATTVVGLAAAVARADESSTLEQDFLVGQLDSAFALNAAETRRLRAHLLMVTAAPMMRLAGLASRLGSLGAADREEIARFCLSVAAADGVVAPAEASTLGKIYQALGLPEARVFDDIREVITPAVTVASAPPVPAVSTPRVQPPHDEPSAEIRAPGPVHSDPPQERRFTLDRAVIAAKLAETAKVGALLGAIFADEEEQASSVSVQMADVELVGGLDAPHSRLLRGLAAEPEWPRAAVEDLCGSLGLLTEGAFDTLNEAAYERVGDPVIEGSDPFTIDSEVIREMLT
jgi:tellurite resistance protein